MGGLRPWTLAWGKLAGATVIPWYGGILCLAVYAASTPGPVANPFPGARQGWTATMFLLAAVLAQAATLFAALHSAGRDRVASRAQSSAYLAFVLLGVYPLVSFGASRSQLRWYGADVAPLDFVVASLAAFAAFAVAGVWVRMRHELRVRTPPLLWPAFVLFAMAWAGGFSGEARRPTARGAAVAIAFGVAVALTWATALVDRKDPVAFRRLARAVRESSWRRAVEELPPWLLALPFALGAALVLLAAPGLLADPAEHLQVRLSVTAVTLFLVRDLALLLHLALGSRPRRAELFAIVLLLAGYVLVPLVLGALGSKPLAALFYPDTDRAAWSAAGAFLQAALLTGLLARRWRARESSVAGAGG